MGVLYVIMLLINTNICNDLPILNAENDKISNKTLKSFSEWKNIDKQTNPNNNAGNNGNIKKVHDERINKNYASQSCGAQILETNPEANNPQAILTDDKDFYTNNPCEATKWTVIKLCEAIDVTSIKFANLEGFSSHPKKIRLSTSKNYPTSDGWHVFAELHVVLDDKAAEWQFPIENDLLIKFIKIEYLEHEGNHHFCPLTHFRVYGLTEEELLYMETMSPETPHSFSLNQSDLTLPDDSCLAGLNMLTWSFSLENETSHFEEICLPNETEKMNNSSRGGQNGRISPTKTENSNKAQSELNSTSTQHKEMASLLKLNGKVKDLEEASVLSERYLDEMTAHYNKEVEEIKEKLKNVEDDGKGKMNFLYTRLYIAQKRVNMLERRIDECCDLIEDLQRRLRNQGRVLLLIITATVAVMLSFYLFFTM